VAWLVTFTPNPSDPHPVAFKWTGPNVGGRLSSSDDSMLWAVERMVARGEKVWATPTGPTELADLHVGHLVFRVVLALGELAGLEPEDIRVEGDGYQWPGMDEEMPAVNGEVLF
jgi:hypothetical protein